MQRSVNYFVVANWQVVYADCCIIRLWGQSCPSTSASFQHRKNAKDYPNDKKNL